MRILVVEDDPKIASFISTGLRQAGFSVDVADNGEDGLVCALDGAYDLAVLDIMLPRLDGLSLLDQLRRRQVNTPVIILSAKRSVEDRIKGLQAGGDDYLTKPFSFSELLARVQAGETLKFEDVLVAPAIIAIPSIAETTLAAAAFMRTTASSIRRTADRVAVTDSAISSSACSLSISA